MRIIACLALLLATTSHSQSFTVPPDYVAPPPTKYGTETVTNPPIVVVLPGTVANPAPEVPVPPLPYVPGPPPTCAPAFDMHNVHSSLDGNGNVETVIWCQIAQNQIQWWSIGGTVTDVLSPACLGALFGLTTGSQQDRIGTAWSACISSQGTDAQAALAINIVNQWIPRVTAVGGKQNVYTIDKNGHIYPYILTNVQQTVTMPNAVGAHCGGPGYSDGHNNWYYNAAGLTTDQGNLISMPITPTSNRLDFAIKCAISYPPASGWTT